jgi:hypothetical protein
MALIVSMLATTLMMALGAGLVLTTSAETLVAANFRNSRDSANAAAAAFELAVADLRRAPEWNDALTGAIRSAFVDGAPGGTRTLADGSALDLSAIVNQANCGRRTACTTTQMDAVTTPRPWGANNPRWKLFAYGPLRNLTQAVNGPGRAGAVLTPPAYVVVLIGDDQADTDANPLADGAAAENPGRGMVVLRAEAYGPRGAHHAVEGTVARPRAVAVGAGGALAGSDAGVRVVSWRELSRIDPP